MLKHIQADVDGCWSLPKAEPKKKALWKVPAKRKTKGQGSAFYPLEETTSGKKRNFKGLVVDAEGRVYGERTLARSITPRDEGGFSSSVKLQNKIYPVETDFQLFQREDGSYAIVECFRLVNIPAGVKEVEEPKMEPVQETAQVLPIVPPVGMPMPVPMSPAAAMFRGQPRL